MQNLPEELIQLLSEDDRLVSEGNLLKNKVIELALNMDAGLIKLLLKNEAIKRHFFVESGDVLVFDKIKFQRFVSNKQFLPDSYTAFKNKIGLVNGNNDYLSESREVVLAWPYKDCILEGGQTKEDQKRDEIFWNETLAPDEIDRLLAPKVFTNFKRYDKDGEHALSGKEKIDFSTENLIIKGNNLLALHSLYKRFAGKVKLIYIDPPYNTGNDEFKYNDNFNHSTWLTFMKNRLEIAKLFLSNDGLIYIQCDDNENAYLKVLLDEVFGRSNLVTTISWQRQPEGRTVLGQGSTFIVGATEYILCYAKDILYAPKINNITKSVDATEKALEQYSNYFNSEGERKLYKEIKDAQGNPIKIYMHKNFEIVRIPSKEDSKIRLKNFKKLSRIAAQQEESSLQQKILSELDSSVLYSVEYTPTAGKSKGENKKSYYYSNGIVLFLKDYADTDGQRVFRLAGMNNFWSHDEIQVTGISDEGGVLLRRGKKPEKLLKRIIQMSTSKDDLVLDYHLGSGTTAAVAHKLGRKYIGVEQIDYEKNDSVVRLKNVVKGDKSGISTDDDVNWQGGGSFIYCELTEHNEAYIDRIQKAKTTKELLAIWKEMQEKVFISYKVDPKTINANISEFESLNLDDQKRFLIEVLDKNQLYINHSEIDDEDYRVSETDKKLNKMFYRG